MNTKIHNCKVKQNSGGVHTQSYVHVLCLFFAEVEVCTVELVEPIEVDGNSATFTFRGVGSDITGFECKLDKAILPNCTSSNKPTPYF